MKAQAAAHAAQAAAKAAEEAVAAAEAAEANRTSSRNSPQEAGERFLTNNFRSISPLHPLHARCS